MARKVFFALLYAVLLAYALGLIVDLWLHPERYQWDFTTYYYAGRALQAGLNPYELDSLSAVAGTEIGFPFLYSPIVLPVFSLLSRLEFLWAYRLYLLLKVLSLGVVLCLWSSWFLRARADPAFYLVCLFGFGGAIYSDLAAGNVSIFEQLWLWLAFAALIKHRPVGFSLMVLVASLFKLTPIAFLLLLLMNPTDRNRRILACALVVFAAVNGLTYLVGPALYRDFLSVAAQLDDRGAINPSTLALVRDIGDILTRKGLPVWATAEAAAYGVFVSIVLALTVLALARAGRGAPRGSVFLACLAFALVAPRFKNYAYILLIPPAYAFVKAAMSRGLHVFGLLPLVLSQSPPVPFGFGGAVRNLFWGYYPWLLALLLWVAAVTQALRGTAPLETGAPSGAGLEAEK